jgi:hypothetical protein
MSAQWIKPNSFRTSLLQALADGAITTIDDLQTRMDEPRKKIQDNIQHAFKEGLLKRLRDDVTGAPAYQITSKGREHLATAAGHQPKEAVFVQAPTPIIDAIDNSLSRYKVRPAEDIAQDVLETARARVAVAMTTPLYPLDEIKVPAPETETETELYVLRLGAILERHLSLESAKERALAVARNGERTVVYKLVLIGTAVPAPGAEWHEQ